MMTLCFEKTDLGSVDEELEDGEERSELQTQEGREGTMQRPCPTPGCSLHGSRLTGPLHIYILSEFLQA